MKLTAVVATHGRGREQRVWLVRSQQKLFAGLWGLPMLVANHSEAPDPRSALRDAGISARLDREPSGQVKHVLTHRRMRVEVFRARRARAAESKSRRLFGKDDLAKVGVSTLTMKLLAAGLGR
jgi:A/G-specific adenine glycosylase